MMLAFDSGELKVSILIKLLVLCALVTRVHAGPHGFGFSEYPAPNQQGDTIRPEG